MRSTLADLSPGQHRKDLRIFNLDLLRRLALAASKCRV